MKKILSFILILSCIVLLISACENSDIDVLKPRINESTIVCNLTSKVITFKGECPVGTKIQVLVRQLTNGTDEIQSDAQFLATEQEFYFNIPNLVGGSTYAYYIICFDSNGAECYRSAERTFTVPDVLKPKIDESTIVCDLTSKVITFKGERPVGTKIQVLVRQLTNGTYEIQSDAQFLATEQEFLFNISKLVGGSTYAYYIIGFDSNGVECYRSAEYTFSLPKSSGPPAPSISGIKAYAPTSLVASDGYLEGSIITEELEYSIDEGNKWMPVTMVGYITGLPSGKVLLRIAETPTREAGHSSYVIVPIYKSNTDLDGNDGHSEGLSSAG